MFFPEKIINISYNDKVLEIGPGAKPFHRSNVLLEKVYKNKEEEKAQFGERGELSTDKKVVFYDGGHFPFNDKEFDYIICSHVLEHVEDPVFFINEVKRVAHKGYFEFPTIYYEYLYNFGVHIQFLLYKDGKVNYLPKSESSLNEFKCIQGFFHIAQQKQYPMLWQKLKPVFFQGFEWEGDLQVNKADSLDMLCFDLDTDIIPQYINNQKMSLREHIAKSVKNILKKNSVIRKFGKF